MTTPQKTRNAERSHKGGRPGHVVVTPGQAAKITKRYAITDANDARAHVAQLLATYEHNGWITTAQANEVDDAMRHSGGTILRKDMLHRLYSLRYRNGFGNNNPHRQRERAMRTAMQRARA